MHFHYAITILLLSIFYLNKIFYLNNLNRLRIPWRGIWREKQNTKSEQTNIYTRFSLISSPVLFFHFFFPFSTVFPLTLLFPLHMPSSSTGTPEIISRDKFWTNPTTQEYSYLTRVFLFNLPNVKLIPSTESKD